MSEKRTLAEIAREIRGNWAEVNFAAKPYLFAMSQLGSVDNWYCQESGREIVLYFLANAGTWRGETARRVKAELKGMLK